MIWFGRKLSVYLWTKRALHGWTRRQEAKLNMDNPKDRPVIDYWEHFAAIDTLRRQLDGINKAGKEQYGQKFVEFTFGEFVTFHGIIEYMVAYPMKAPRETYWRDKPSDDEPGPPHNLGRFMTKNRWETFYHL